MTTKNLIKELEILSQSKENTIEKAVAIEALMHDDVSAFFSDLFQYGCVSGMVNSLIYYVDTHTFFDTHYHQIENIRTEYEESTGTSYVIKSDLKNDLAWFAFEYIALQVSQNLGLDV